MRTCGPAHCSVGTGGYVLLAVWSVVCSNNCHVQCVCTMLQSIPLCCNPLPHIAILSRMLQSSPPMLSPPTQSHTIPSPHTNLCTRACLQVSLQCCPGVPAGIVAGLTLICPTVNAEVWRGEGRGGEEWKWREKELHERGLRTVLVYHQAQNC